MGKIIIAGGSGFIGQHLTQEFGDRAVVLTRSSDLAKGEVHWDAKNLGSWVDELEGADAVIGLSGASISARKTGSNVREILDSRVRATQVIGRALLACACPPPVWINAGAMGFYGDQGDDLLDESYSGGDDFAARVCEAWEAEVHRAVTPKTRKVVLRISFVLGHDGGGFPILETLTRWGLGGAAGSGRQWLSWMHISDLCQMFRWSVESQIEGTFNASTPNPVRNGDFMKCLRHRLRRPWSPPAPAFALRMLSRFISPDPSLSLVSIRMDPSRAMNAGFEFRYPTLSAALDELIG